MNDDVDPALRALYAAFHAGWNARDATAMAALLAPDGLVIGFDGSEMTGPVELSTALSGIFIRHSPPRYVAKVREVHRLDERTAMLHAVVGMIPDGDKDIIPELNAVQCLVAVHRAGAWRIALFQNTPAQYHGRPELAEQLSRELRALR